MENNMRQPLFDEDITIYPPPCTTRERAHEIYAPTFRRVIEYVTIGRIPGDILEFGTFRGYTARMMAEMMQEYKNPNQLYLYDSWEGFPELWGNDAGCPDVVIHKVWNRGDCKVRADGPQLIQQALNILLPDRVHTIKGYYEKTVPEKLPKRASVVHIDCDLHLSTHHVLAQLIKNNIMSDGCIILFDDYNSNHASNNFGERRAMRDLFPVYRDGEHWTDGSPSLSLEKWFSYGSAGCCFFLHKHE